MTTLKKLFISYQFYQVITFQISSLVFCVYTVPMKSYDKIIHINILYSKIGEEKYIHIN